jgi:hypothetical protein
MDIQSKPGTKVFFLGINGHTEELKQAKEKFQDGQVLTVKEMNVGHSSSRVSFEEVDGWYNTVMFENCDRVYFPADRVPRAVRPLETEYMVIGDILNNHNIYNLTDAQFIALVMKKSNGGMNPARVKQIYNNLCEDAGLMPKESWDTWFDKHPEVLDKILADIFDHDGKKLK